MKTWPRFLVISAKPMWTMPIMEYSITSHVKLCHRFGLGYYSDLIRWNGLYVARRANSIESSVTGQWMCAEIDRPAIVQFLIIMTIQVMFWQFDTINIHTHNSYTTLICYMRETRQTYDWLTGEFSEQVDWLPSQRSLSNVLCQPLSSGDHLPG